MQAARSASPSQAPAFLSPSRAPALPYPLFQALPSAVLPSAALLFPARCRRARPGIFPLPSFPSGTGSRHRRSRSRSYLPPRPACLHIPRHRPWSGSAYLSSASICRPGSFRPKRAGLLFPHPDADTGPLSPVPYPGKPDNSGRYTRPNPLPAYPSRSRRRPSGCPAGSGPTGNSVSASSYSLLASFYE